MKVAGKIVRVILLLISCLALLYFTAFIIRKMSVVNDLTIIQTPHFNIIYSGILKSEAESLSNYLEENYDRIRMELNDPAHDTIHVFIHSTQDEFNAATGLTGSTANGTSRGPKAFHLMYQTWYNNILPVEMEKVAVHEFTHCVQLNILIEDARSKFEYKDNADFDKQFEKEFEEQYPQWFWEAVCDYEAGIVNKTSVRYAMKGKPTLKFLNQSNQVYNVGYSIVDYMVTTWGKDRLPDFIRSYGDFEKVFQINESEFEQGWYKFVESNY